MNLENFTKTERSIISAAITGVLFFLLSMQLEFPPGPSQIYMAFVGALISFISQCRPIFNEKADPVILPPVNAIPGPDPDPSPRAQAPPLDNNNKDGPKFPPLGVIF